MTFGTTTPGLATDAVVPFGERLELAFVRLGQLCVGIDPHAWLLSAWGLPDSAAGAEAFGRKVVEASIGRVGIVKPQLAFFERFGSAGYAALERILKDARDAGLLVIADVKRGDLGASVEAYGEAWLMPGSPLEVDAITVSAYLGVGSLDAPFALAAEKGKGLFLLSATSNPEGADIQRAIVAHGARAGLTVARAILEDVAERNTRASLSARASTARASTARGSTARGSAASGSTASGSTTLGSIGVVLGATLNLATFGIDVTAAPLRALTPVLAPGFGHQGAEVADLTTVYGSYARGVIVSESRSILSAGPDRLAEAIVRRVAEVGAHRA